MQDRVLDLKVSTFKADFRGRLWDSARGVCSILYNNGYECYAVGGAIRDQLLGKEPHDIDLATDAKPDEVKEIFRRNSCKVYDTGTKFGTVTVTCDDENYFEVTTFRGEKYRRGSRKPKVTFSKSIYDDVKRRDFTINALAYDFRTGKVLDFFNGLEDLKNGIIRAVGDPEERFREDPLRIFRMCRFASTLGFRIDEETFNAAKKVAEELKWISMERKTEETHKAFIKSDKPSTYIKCLMDCDAMKYYIPELYELENVEQPPPHREDVLEHTLIALDHTPNDYITRMAALLHDIAKPEVKRDSKPYFPRHEEKSAVKAERILRRTRHSRKETDSIVNLVRNHGFLLSGKIRDDKQARRTILRLARNGVRGKDLDRLIDLVKADTMATLGLSDYEVAETEKSLELIEKWKFIPTTRFELDINGRDLLDAGIEPKSMNWIFNKLLDYVADDPTRNNKETLMKRAIQLAKSIGAIKK